ncbi:MAG: transcription termination/antitermination protein NusA [Candidatus Binataceae bacterium]|jgi:N utilization substance protein A|nr:transcription termination/antitermination protein NusA [Candidatus Binataceae bacterium]
MSVDLNRVIEQVSKEKGIDKTIVVNAVEEMMHSAARRTFGPDRNIESRFNPEIGEIELFEIKTVVATVANAGSEVELEEAHEKYDPEAQVGDEILIKLDTATMGRIAAQAAKQNLIQHIRDAERKQIFNEFKDRKGEIVSGIVQRFERKNMIVNLGRTEAILPEKEQIPHERYRQGDRIRALILDVDLSEKGLSIVLSRTSNLFLMKLFEQEVPEIYEAIVEIRQCAREPGGRAKVAVYSKDNDVDPVGACVGMKGTRVQSVVQELRGEKIDIVPWTDDQAELVCRALAPAKVSKVVIDEDEHAMEVIVPDDQLSLAIGKRGQNVRLAHRLSGWKLDVRSDSEAEEEARAARASLNAIPGIGDINAELLYQWGFRSAEQLSEANEDNFEVEGISPERARQVILAARDWVETKRRLEEQKAAAAQAALETGAETAGTEAAGTEADGAEELGAVDGGAESTDENVTREGTADDAEVKS